MKKNRNSLDAKKESRLRSKNTTSNAVAVNMSDPSGKRLFADARPIIAAARANAVQSVDFNRVMMYWNLAKRIFEEEQHGKDRADYSTCLVRNLAASLDPEYGSGFSYRQQAFSRLFKASSTMGSCGMHGREAFADSTIGRRRRR